MSREIVVLWAGRHRRQEWDELCARYRKRIARMRPVRDQPIKVRGGDEVQRRRKEGRALLAALPPRSWAIALDAGGETLDSEGFAALMERLGRRPHPLAFLLGSDLGLAPEVISTARQTLSLGAMTLSHELARLVLYEQLYRALSINAGISYHRGSF